MMQKWIFTDIDGTLLNKKKNIFPNVINALKKRAVYDNIVIASGRTPNEVLDFVNSFQLENILYPMAICLNGQLIINIKTKKEYYKKYISYSESLFFTSVCKQQNIIYIIFVKHRDGSEEILTNNSEIASYRLSTKRIGISESDVLSEDIIMKLYYLSQNTDIMLSVKKIFDECFCGFDTYYKKQISGNDYYENIIMPKSTDKGKAALWIIGDSTSQNNIIGIGNGINDIPLFKICNYSIALQGSNKNLVPYSHILISNSNLASIIEKL
ncbi:MAG: Cof-type HAD-IIB family hydrolase [Lachnospiraceae bacterium]